jgi:glycosyltransferase involved in cell wall biosynthesis
MSRVDVIVPCYNYGRYLPACLRSVLSQEGIAVRVLVIDDASPDGSGAVAEELARQDGRVEARRHPVNRGHIATYNEGLDWAEGDYALLLSADDLLAPEALLRAARLLDARPEVSLTYGRQIRFATEGPPEAPPPAGRAGGWRVLAGREFIAECCRTGGNPVSTPTAVVRTSLWKELGGYRAELPHTADMELWLRFAAHTDVGVIDAVQALKRVHPDNMQYQYLGPELGDLRQRYAAFEALFSGYGRRVRGAPSLWAQATAVLADQAFWAGSRAFDRGDVTACRQCLEYALSLDPGLRDRRPWARLRWKQRLGPRIWRVVRPVLERLRRTPSLLHPQVS